MPGVQGDEMGVGPLKTHPAKGLTRLIDLVRQANRGYVLNPYRVHSRLSLPGIEIVAMRGHHHVPERYQSLGKGTPCRVLIVDSGLHNRIYMDVESLAYLLDAAIASDQGHYLRRPTAPRKDTDG